MPETTSKPMRHAILGAGGVGSLIGACLAHAGVLVTLVVRRESLENYPKQLRLESPFGNFAVDVAVAAEVPAVDVLWLTVKATQLEPALTAITNPEAARAIVPLLNGIDHVALLRARYGAEHVIPATIAGEMERVSPGHIVHRSPFAVLNVSSAGRTLLGSTIDQLQHIGFTCSFIDDEPTLMWGKLVFLAPFALSTTAADKTVGEILSDPQWRSLGEACVREACAVGCCRGRQSQSCKRALVGSGCAGRHAQFHAKGCRQAQPTRTGCYRGPHPPRRSKTRDRDSCDEEAGCRRRAAVGVGGEPTRLV